MKEFLHRVFSDVKNNIIIAQNADRILFCHFFIFDVRKNPVQKLFHMVSSITLIPVKTDRSFYSGFYAYFVLLDTAQSAAYKAPGDL